MSKIYTSADQLIGHTPLLELTHIEAEEALPAKVLAKLEYFNPAGSVKDRIAKAMIDDAEAAGKLKPGSVIIEPTSGNTVEEILNLTEGSLATVSCLAAGAAPCRRMSECRTYKMWKGLDDLISNYFRGITLADLAAPEETGNDYVI